MLATFLKRLEENNEMKMEQMQEPILSRLVQVMQSACLLSVAMIQGEATPYWFLERIVPDSPARDELAERGGAQERKRRNLALDQVKQEVTPLSRFLLETYQTLDACWQTVQDVSLADDERAWLLTEIPLLIQLARDLVSTVEWRESVFRIVDALVVLILRLGPVLATVLADRAERGTLDRLDDALQGTKALYHAIAHVSQEQQDLLTGELDIIIPYLTSVRKELKERELGEVSLDRRSDEQA
jgi:hypothetical protein